jgi:hypothetical protein
MRRFRWFVLSAAFVVSVLAFAACGGGSSSKTPSSGSTPLSGATTASGATAAPGATDDASSSNATASNPEIQAVIDKFTKSTFKGTYKTSGTEADNLGTGQLTLEKDGDSKFRFDVTTSQGGQDVSSIFIETPNVSALCLKDAGDLGALLGVDPGQGVCFNSPADDPSNPAGGLRDLFSGVQNSNVTLVEKTSRNIAGQDGTCYKTKDNASGDISTACFTSDGAMLYIQTEGADGSEIEAQSISTSVSADDFKLPYEVKALPPGFDEGSGD